MDHGIVQSAGKLEPFDVCPDRLRIHVNTTSSLPQTQNSELWWIKLTSPLSVRSSGSGIGSPSASCLPSTSVALMLYQSAPYLQHLQDPRGKRTKGQGTYIVESEWQNSLPRLTSLVLDFEVPTPSINLD